MASGLARRPARPRHPGPAIRHEVLLPASAALPAPAARHSADTGPGCCGRLGPASANRAGQPGRTWPSILSPFRSTSATTATRPPPTTQAQHSGTWSRYATENAAGHPAAAPPPAATSSTPLPGRTAPPRARVMPGPAVVTTTTRSKLTAGSSSRTGPVTTPGPPPPGAPTPPDRPFTPSRAQAGQVNPSWDREWGSTKRRATAFLWSRLRPRVALGQTEKESDREGVRSRRWLRDR